MTAIETLGQWYALAAELRKAGYTVYMMQYGADQPEGFRIRFWHPGRPDVWLVTHSMDVQEAMVNYKSRKSQ